MSKLPEPWLRQPPTSTSVSSTDHGRSADLQGPPSRGRSADFPEPWLSQPPTNTRVSSTGRNFLKRARSQCSVLNRAQSRVPVVLDTLRGRTELPPHGCLSGTLRRAVFRVAPPVAQSLEIQVAPGWIVQRYGTLRCFPTTHKCSDSLSERNWRDRCIFNKRNPLIKFPCSSSR